MEGKILVIEDDREINELIVSALLKEGYQADPAFEGESALRAISSGGYDLILLDLMVPGIDGYEILQKIRESYQIPVIIVSAKDEDLDIVAGLRMGADDYITKPFKLGELRARVLAQLRRYFLFNTSPEEKVQKEKCLRYGELSLNFETYKCCIKEKEISLTAKEFEILKLLMTYPHKVFTKENIFSKIWQDEFLADDNTVMVHIRRLRKKIEEDPSNPQYISTVWGIGYKMGELSK